MNDYQRRQDKKLESMISGYYFLVLCSALTLVLTALSSLLTYKISSILTPVLSCVFFVEILCCILRFLQIRDMVVHCPVNCHTAPNCSQHTKHIGLWIAADFLLIILGIYPLFPFWLQALFRALALALLLCLMLWTSKAYRKYKQYP